MISERQRIEAPPTPSMDNSMPPPPPYEEVNGVYASQTTHNGSTDSMGYFLGEVIKSSFLFFLRDIFLYTGSHRYYKLLNKWLLFPL